MFWSALGDDASTLLSALGTKIDDPIGLFNYIQVVLDDEYRIAKLDEAVEDGEQLAYVVEVQTRGGFVEDVEGAAGLPAGKLTRQLGPLGLTAGQSCGGLAKLNVAESDVNQGLQLLLDRRNIFEHFQGFLNGQIE